MNKEEAKKRVAELCKKYEGLSAPEIKQKNEEATKLGFIQPLFTALGWDFTDNNEVAPEEKASGGRVDYAFKLNGVSQFYLEAKPLKADLSNPNYAKQAVTYAYNTGVTWAVLSDFEKIIVYVAQTGKPFLNLSYIDFLNNFEDIWLLSKESFLINALGGKAEKYGQLPVRIGIEQKLFGQLRQWRGQLLNELPPFNDLTFRQADEIIQKLFDRLIFIRTAEDRGIEDKVLLAAVHQWKVGGYKGELFDTIKRIFREFDGYYDSDLFAPHPVDKVFIMGTTIASIIEGLYEIPGGISSYDFAVIDADVLGAVYEQYLGYVGQIEKDKAKEAQKKLDLGIQTESVSLVEKKQRRKDQGIYYTPKFVTDYIVKETVGRFLAEHSGTANRNIKILDPACGSGSFLIRAFDELLKYYAGQRISKSENDIDAADRISILTNNIFGVDLDKQAVEIARLNLLLRSLAKRDILPSLKDNIRQGNSLISGTEEELKGYFGNDWRNKKPFNWNEEFCDIMAKGGFDVVIGNPPYGAELDEEDRSYITDCYPLSKDNKNSAMIFIERGLSLTKEGGFFSFIVPKSLAYSQQWATGRELILDRLGSACDASKAFKEVLLEQMVIVVSQKFVHKPFYESMLLEENAKKKPILLSKTTSKNTDTILLSVTNEELKIFNKMTESKRFMKDVSKTARGLPYQKYLTKDSKGMPIYRGDHIARYTLFQNKETLPIAILSDTDKKVAFLRQPKILSQQIIAHVTKPNDHIILMSTLDKEGVLTLDTIQNTVVTDNNFTLAFITGLLNSQLWSWYAYRFIFSKAIRTMHFDAYYMSKFPLPMLDFFDPADKKVHDKIVALVNNMLESNKKLALIPDNYNNEKEDLKLNIEKTDKEIDKLVYKLYKLNDDEIAIVNQTHGTN